MYKIGEFSKITGFTVKTLRYYDEETILSPSFRNQENSYRYYNEEDYKKAELIHLLRELDFSISEMKDALSVYGNPSDLSYILEEKKQLVRKRIEQETELLNRINQYIDPEKREVKSQDYRIEIREIPPLLVASLRYRGSYEEMGNYIPRLYKAVKGNAAGVPFNCYYDDSYQENADIEICIPIRKKITDDQINFRELMAFRGISATHRGPYKELSRAYKAIFDFAEQNRYRCITPSREVYIKGPGFIFKGNPNNYVTEILVPFEPEY